MSANDLPAGGPEPGAAPGLGNHATPPFDAWQGAQAWTQTWVAGLDPQGQGRWQREVRLAGLIDTALQASPWYRRSARGARRLADFPPVSKPELMAAFDDWSTDRRITRRGAEAFIRDGSRIADAWLGRYLVWTSSGTSGHPGIFVQDAASLAAYDAIESQRLRGVPAGLGAFWGMGRRFAFVLATGGHFAGLVSLQRLRRLLLPGLAPQLHVLSVLDPLEDIAARLAAIQPDVLVTYPSCADALAQRQARGALRLAPSEVWLGGEQLTDGQRRSIAAAWDCPVRNAYGASECYAMAYACAQGQLHLNDDWVILEALDAQGRPVVPGEFSSITLLTNLANRTQPLIRYRLDDRLRYLPQGCACGSRFPRIEVCGRADDTLHLTGHDGQPVDILPLALETALEEGAGVTQFQVVCGADGVLEVRVAPDVPEPAAAREACRACLDAFLGRHGVPSGRVRASDLPPQAQSVSGKVKRVIGRPAAR